MSNINLSNIWDPNNYNSEEVPALEVTQRMLIRKSASNSVTTTLAADGIALFGQNPFDAHIPSDQQNKAVVINATAQGNQLVTDYGSMIVDKNLDIGNNLEVTNNVGIRGKLSVTELCPTNLDVQRDLLVLNETLLRKNVTIGSDQTYDPNDQTNPCLIVKGDIKLCGTIIPCGNQTITLGDLNTDNLKANALTVNNGTTIQKLDGTKNVDFNEISLTVKGKSQFLGNTLELNNDDRNISEPMLKIVNTPSQNTVNPIAIRVESGETELKQTDIVINNAGFEALRVTNNLGTIVNFMGSNNETRLKLNDSQLIVETKILANNSIDLTGDINLNKDGNVVVKNIKNITKSNPSRQDDETIEISSTKDINITTHIDANVNIDSELIAKKNTTLEAKLYVSDTTTLTSKVSTDDALIVNGSAKISNNLSIGDTLHVNGDFQTNRLRVEKGIDFGNDVSSETVFINMGRLHSVTDVTDINCTTSSINPNNVVFRPAHNYDGTCKSDVYMGYYWKRDIGSTPGDDNYPFYEHHPATGIRVPIKLVVTEEVDADNLKVISNSNLGGTLDVIGKTTLHKDLDVADGVTTSKLVLSKDGNEFINFNETSLTLGKDLNHHTKVKGNLNIDGSLSVSGTIFTSEHVDTKIQEDLSIHQKCYISPYGELIVDGGANLNGDTTIDVLSVTNSANIKGDLLINGEIKGYGINNLKINSNLSICKEVYIDNNLTVKSLTKSEYLSVGEKINTTDLSVSNNITTKYLTVQNIPTMMQGINVANGTTTLKETHIVGNLSVTGNLDADDITIDGKNLKTYLKSEQLNCLDSLTVDKTTTLKGDTTIVGALTLNKTISVTGQSTLSNTDITGTFTVNDDVTINQNKLEIVNINTKLSNTEIDGALTIKDSGITINNEGITSTLKKTTLGETEIKGALTITNNSITLDNHALTINKPTTFCDALSVNNTAFINKAEIEQNLTVKQHLYLGNSIKKTELSDYIEIDADLSVNGTIEANDITIGNKSLKDYLKGEDLTFLSKLTVTGDSCLKKTNIDSILSVAGDTNLGGDLKLTNNTKYFTVAGTTELNNTKILGDFEVSNSSVQINDQGLTVTKNTTLSNTHIKGDFTLDNSIVKIDNSGLTVNGLSSLYDVNICGEINLDNKIIVNKRFVNIDATTTIKKLNVLNDFSVFNANLSIDSSGINNRSLTRLANTDIDGILNVTSANVNINDEFLEVKKNTKLNHLEITGNFKLDNEAVTIDETGLTVKRQSNLANTKVDGDLTVEGRLILAGGIAQEDIHDIYVQSELSVAEHAYIGNTLSVGLGIDNPVINTSNYTATNIVKKVDLIKTKEVDLVDQIDKLDDNIDITAVKSLKSDRICLTTYNKTNNQFQFINLKRNILWTKVNLKSIAAKITLRNQNPGLYIGELSAIVQDPINKDNVYIVLSYNDKSTKCILFLKYNLIDNELHSLFNNIDDSIVQFTNIHSPSLLVWENNLLAVSESDNSIIFYGLDLPSINTSKFIEDSENPKYRFKISINTISSYLSQSILKFTNIKIEHTKLNEYHVVLEIDEKYLVAYKVILDLLNVSNSDLQYLGHININSEHLSSDHKLNNNIENNNYRLEGISNRNIVFKQYIKEDESEDSDDYLSYISYTYSDVNERYFPDLTSAAVKVKFTDKKSSDDLPDYLSLSSIKHSEFNNDIRLSGLRHSTDTLEHTSNTYNYMDTTLIDVRNAVKFEKIPDLMTQKNGIQFFSDDHLTLTRTKESVIITPNIDIITLEDTNVLMEKDLDVLGSLDIKGNTRVHNTLDILDDINVTNNINVENSINVTNTIKTNNLEVNSLIQNSVPFIDTSNKISSTNNLSWNNTNNLLEINKNLNAPESGEFANLSGLSLKGNVRNSGNIINTADFINQNNTYNMKNMFVGGTLRAGGITDNKTNISENILEFNKTSYNENLIPDSSKYEKGIHTIENKPLYISDSTFINGGLDIVQSGSREDLSSDNRLSKSNTTVTITGNTKIFNGDLDITGHNIDKSNNLTIKPNGTDNLLSSGYAKIIDTTDGKVINTGNINADGMLRVGLHYNLYEKLTKDLDHKTYTDFNNLPINLAENKDNIEYLRGKKDPNSYYAASNLISGRFNDIYGNTLIERRHSDLVFPMDNTTKKIDIKLTDASAKEITELDITKSNKSLSRIHSYIGWTDNSEHKLKSTTIKEAPHEFVRLKKNGDKGFSENFALDISSDKVEGKLDLFAQSVTIGGKNRYSSIIEETPVNNIREYFSNEHLSEFYPNIGSGLIITKKPETGLGFPPGEITVTFEYISRIGLLRPTISAKINEIGNVVIQTINPGKGWKNTDEIKYNVEFIPEDGDQFTYTSQNIKDLSIIPASFKNEDGSLNLVLLELEFTVDSNGRMKSFFANNMSNLQIDKYDKLSISIGDNMGLLDENSLEIINKNNFNIVSGNLDINSQKDIKISAIENLNIQNNNGKTAIKITNNDKGQLIIDSEKTILINNSIDNHLLDLSDPTNWEESKYPDGQTMQFINKNAENFENSTNIGGIVGKLVHNKEIDNNSYKRFYYSWANDIKGTQHNTHLKDKYIQGFNYYNKNDINKKHNPYSLMSAWNSDSVNYVSKPKFNVSGLPTSVNLKNSLSNSDFYSLGGFDINTTNMYDQTRNDNQVLRTAKQNIKLDLSLTGDMVFIDSVKARNNYRFNNSTISTDNSSDLETYVDSSGFSFEYNTKISEQDKEISSNRIEKAEFKEIYRIDITSEPLFTFKVPVVKCIEESTIDVISDKNSVFNINNEWTDNIDKTIIRKKQLDKKANIHTVFYSSILNLLGNQSNNIEIYGDNITSKYGDNRRAIYERIIETDKEKTEANKTGGVIGKQTVTTLIGKTVYNHYFNYNSNSKMNFSNDNFKKLYESRQRLGVYNTLDETSWLYEAFLTPGIGLMSFCKKNNINSTLYDIQNIVDENKIKKTIGYDGIVNDAFLVKKSAKLLGIKITIKDGSVIYRTPIENSGSGQSEYTVPTNFGTFIGVNIKKLNTRNNKDKLKQYLVNDNLDSYLNLLYGENKWNINKTNGEIDGVSIKPFLSSLEIYNKAEVDEEPITKDTVPHILNGKSVSSWSVPDNLKENYYVEAGETLLVNYEIRINKGVKYPDVVLLPSINNTDPNFEKEIVIPQTLKKSFEKIKDCNIQFELIWENESDLKDTKEILDNSGLPDVNIVINEETELLD